MTAIEILKKTFKFHLYKHHSYFTNRDSYYVKVNGREKEITKEQYLVLAEEFRRDK